MFIEIFSQIQEFLEFVYTEIRKILYEKKCFNKILYVMDLVNVPDGFNNHYNYCYCQQTFQRAFLSFQA